MNHRLRENMSFDFGVRNIFDTGYELAEGFAEAGRTFFLGMALTFRTKRARAGREVQPAPGDPPFPVTAPNRYALLHALRNIGVFALSP